MDTTVVQLIGSYGFPIVACIAMAWYIKDNTKSQRDEISRLNAEHKEEMEHVTEAINNNTLVIQKLCDKLGGD